MKITAKLTLPPTNMEEILNYLKRVATLGGVCFASKEDCFRVCNQKSHEARNIVLEITKLSEEERRQIDEVCEELMNLKKGNQKERMLKSYEQLGENGFEIWIF